MNRERSTLYRTLWRWHFYAGLFVMPMILILAVTGSIYLFRPQIERWEERDFQRLPITAAATPSFQRDAALAAYPGSTFSSYRLPERAGDAALVHLGMPDGSMRDAFISPQGTVLGSFDSARRIVPVVQNIHGQLLLGPRGSWLVELAASWAIVMIVTGLYLWWPAGTRFAGVLWPRVTRGGRAFWRDLHAVTGFWVSALALVLLVTGLPWAGVWGSAFKLVREEMGWVKGAQDWTIGGRPATTPDAHRDHDHGAMAGHGGHGQPDMLDAVVAKAAAQRLAFPVVVTPPGAPREFGRPGGATWSVRSDSQNRPLRTTIEYDALTAQEVSREGFAQKHAIDRVVGYGIAWHEGQLFGLANQLIGLATALSLIALSVSGFVMWRTRKARGELGAPPAPRRRPPMKAVAPVATLLVLTLPLFALSLAALALADRLVLPRLPRLARWLGMPSRA